MQYAALAIILLLVFSYIVYFLRQERKEHERYMKGEEDKRDVTDKMYDFEPYDKYFKRKP